MVSVLVFFLFCTLANASVGLTELAGREGDGPVTVFYPTKAKAEAYKRGPFTMQLARQAAPQRGNGRLVIMSHGSGGNPWVHSDLARALVEAGFVAAMPEHRGDNARDPGNPGPESWKRRPGEVSRAIDAVAGDARFSPLLQLDKVGVYGMSAGGHTALSFAGGRWSPTVLRQHCEANIEEDFYSCVGLATRLRGDGLDWLRIFTARNIIRWNLRDATWYAHDDARVRAVVAAVPYAVDFDMASLAAPRVPLGLVTAGQDIWLKPQFHSSAVLKACAKCELVSDLPDGGHGALLSPMPPVLPENVAALLKDPPGFDRGVLPEVDRKIAAFFRRHLLP